MSAHPLITRLVRVEGLPRKELEAFAARREEMTPVLLDILRRAVSDEGLTLDEFDSLFFVVHLLAEFREPQAFPLITAFLRHDAEMVDETLGDAITETLKGVLISTFNGDRAALEGVVEDAEAEEFVRAAAFDAWCYLVVAGKIDRDHAERYLRDCAHQLQPRNYNFVWSAWLDAAARLGLADLRDEVGRAIADGRIDDFEANLSDFDQMLEEARTTDDPVEMLRRDHIRPFTTTIAEFETWHGFSAEYLREQRQREIAEHMVDTVVNPHRHVGRNDPCPCGSGKKFKKCCGG